MLLFVPKERQKTVREALASYREVEFEFEPEGSRIIFIEGNRGNSLR